MNYEFDPPPIQNYDKRQAQTHDELEQQNASNYFQALERITQILQSLTIHPNSFMITLPMIEKLGYRKTLWTNFQIICDQIHRDPLHVCRFFQIEFGVLNIQIQDKLLFRGRFRSQNIQNILKKYIIEYVICAQCKSMDTQLIRDQDTRLYSKQCMICKATMNVASMRTIWRKQQ